MPLTASVSRGALDVRLGPSIAYAYFAVRHRCFMMIRARSIACGLSISGRVIAAHGIRRYGRECGITCGATCHRQASRDNQRNRIAATDADGTVNSAEILHQIALPRMYEIVWHGEINMMRRACRRYISQSRNVRRQY